MPKLCVPICFNVFESKISSELVAGWPGELEWAQYSLSLMTIPWFKWTNGCDFVDFQRASRLPVFLSYLATARFVMA